MLVQSLYNNNITASAVSDESWITPPFMTTRNQKLLEGSLFQSNDYLIWEEEEGGRVSTGYKKKKKGGGCSRDGPLSIESNPSEQQQQEGLYILYNNNDVHPSSLWAPIKTHTHTEGHYI